LISNHPEDYSDPTRVIELPFPFTGIAPWGFAFTDNSSISYMGRESFAVVWDAFCQIKKDIYHRQSIYVYGGMGVGKSHILMALACLLVRQGHRVVYFPDCLQMLRDPLTYLRTALFFAFAASEFSLLREDIYQCKSIEALADCCSNYQTTGQLCFIIDQLNALDPAPI
jgi:hypothetical protein